MEAKINWYYTKQGYLLGSIPITSQSQSNFTDNKHHQAVNGRKLPFPR